MGYVHLRYGNYVAMAATAVFDFEGPRDTLGER